MSSMSRLAAIHTGMDDICVRTNCPFKEHGRHVHPPVVASSPTSAPSPILFLDVDVDVDVDEPSPRYSPPRPRAWRHSRATNDLSRYSFSNHDRVSRPVNTLSGLASILEYDARRQQYSHNMQRCNASPEVVPHAERSATTYAPGGNGRRLPSLRDLFGPDGDLIGMPAARDDSSYTTQPLPLEVSARESGPSSSAVQAAYGSPASTHSDISPSPASERHLFSYYDFECSANPTTCKGEQNIRKAVSHFFGRNKGCTKAIRTGMWLSYCRKHYQRIKYNAQKGNSWPTVQHEQLAKQMRKFDKHFTCNNWEIKFNAGLGKAIEYFKETGNMYDERVDKKYHEQIAPAFLFQDFLGRGKTGADVWDIIHLMKDVVDRGDIKEENLAIEFLPHGFTIRSDAPGPYKCPDRNVVPTKAEKSPRARATKSSTARSRTNRAAAAGTGRHATHHAGSYRAASPRQAATDYRQLPYPGTADRVLPSIGERSLLGTSGRIVLPPLDASRRPLASGSYVRQ